MRRATAASLLLAWAWLAGCSAFTRDIEEFPDSACSPGLQRDCRCGSALGSQQCLADAYTPSPPALQRLAARDHLGYNVVTNCREPVWRP